MPQRTQSSKTLVFDFFAFAETAAADAFAGTGVVSGAAGVSSTPSLLASFDPVLTLLDRALLSSGKPPADSRTACFPELRDHPLVRNVEGVRSPSVEYVLPGTRQKTTTLFFSSNNRSSASFSSPALHRLLFRVGLCCIPWQLPTRHCLCRHCSFHCLSN